jgi:hypothetical protein
MIIFVQKAVDKAVDIRGVKLWMLFCNLLKINGIILLMTPGALELKS